MHTGKLQCVVQEQAKTLLSNHTIYTFVYKYVMETIGCFLHRCFMYRASFYAVKKLKSAQGCAQLAPLHDTCGAVMVRSGIPRRFLFMS